MRRIEENMDNHDLYDPLQSAYRDCHSTETAVMKVHNDIVSTLSIYQCAVFVSLDLSAAFDIVDHCILLKQTIDTRHPWHSTEMVNFTFTQNIKVSFSCKYFKVYKFTVYLVSFITTLMRSMLLALC